MKNAIIEKIKSLGFNSRQVSVKENRASMNWSFTVTIRDASINLKAIETAVKAFEKIDRCQATGEILNGANCYVGVAVDEKVKATWAAQYIDRVNAAIAQFEATPQGNLAVEIISGYNLFEQRPGVYSLHHFGQDGAGRRIGYAQYSAAESIALAIHLDACQAAVVA